MDDVQGTIFYPLTQGLIDRPEAAHHVAVLNAPLCAELAELADAHLFLQQYFKPRATALQDQGYTVSSTLPGGEEACDYVFAVLPKNAVEAQYLAARGLAALKPGGFLVCAAGNKAGGGRILKMLQHFGLGNLENISKNKMRVVWGRKEECDEEAIHDSVRAGEMQPVLNGDFVSQPGIFGWDKIDRGSDILAQHIPPDLSGRGADFGCGYGYLSRYAAQNCDAVHELVCIDADYRAVRTCQENLKETRDDLTLRFFWEDLTGSVSGVSDLDFIIMNPPFHEGKKTDYDIGLAFIQTAFESLSPGGALWMVANAHLPYENALSERFSSVDKKFEREGFKVFCAIK